MNKKANTRCGYVALIGRPNVGKSTLLNKILQQKISIISPKPQTTRQRILGIYNKDNTQMIFIDTPGIQPGAKKTLNRIMNRAAKQALSEADVIVFLIEALQWQSDDDWIVQQLSHLEKPVLLAVNKIDALKDKNLLLPFLQQVTNHYPFAAIIPISATKAENIQELIRQIRDHLPAQPFIFPEDQVTDKSERFIAAEIIREKLMNALEQEVPYALSVEVEQFQDTAKLLRIAAVIYVEKSGQKAIVIGAQGALLKKIGREARLELQAMYNKKVFLQLWVKIKNNWSDDARMLKNLGYE